MIRVGLIHWNAKEGKERQTLLRRAGYNARVHLPENATGLRPLRENPPRVFLIDLSRLPAQGRELAINFRRSKKTSLVPIVFVDGDPKKVKALQKLLPDAEYTTWSRIKSSINRAIKNSSKTPVVPDAMEGYSGVPLPKKLGLKPGLRVSLLGAPDGFEEKLKPIPENIILKKQARGSFNLIVLFARSRADLKRRFPAAARSLETGGGLWIAWPKKASRLSTDLTQAEVRSFGIDKGFVDYKICAIDKTWSGLLFARRAPRK